MPRAFERPVVERERRAGISLGLVAPEPAGRNEAVGARITDVGLGRLELGQRGGGLGPGRSCPSAIVGVRGRMAGLGQQLADDPFGHRIFALAEMVVADAALGIDEVMRGPVMVVERAPQDVVVVERDRIS